MEEKINYLKERIDNISSIMGVGDIDPKNIMKNPDNKNKTISDTINYIKSQMNDNSNLSTDTIKKSK